jgi:Fanconi anemia group M protein
MEYINQKFIKPDFIQKRLYQVHISQDARNKNSLVVLPTGLGKTIIAILILTYKLTHGKIFFLSPTKPLCEQHASLIRKTTTLKRNEIKLITGETHTVKQRVEAYKTSRIIIATPQIIRNDLNQRLSLRNVSLMIFDEAHRAVGSYAYVAVAQRYLSMANRPQVLGLTASPGSDFTKLEEVAENLGLEHIELRSELDEDVRTYIPSRVLDWELIEMPREIKQIKYKIDRLLHDFLTNLQKYTRQAKGLSPDNLSKRVLLEIQGRMKKNLGQRGGTLYHAISIVSAAIKLSHLRDMLTSQGLTVARAYIAKLDEDTSKAAQKIKKKPLYQDICQEIMAVKSEKTKLNRAKGIIQSHFNEHSSPKIMVFAEYRDTINLLVSELNQMKNIQASPFIGQAKGKREGMSQDQQKKTLEEFRAGTFNVLVSTSIGEEGIDIPATSMVLFYEPVPSAIRYIQRKGRTARDGKPGKVKILIMKGSRDEAYYWNSRQKEKKMYDQILRLKQKLENGYVKRLGGQTKLDNF